MCFQNVFKAKLPWKSKGSFKESVSGGVSLRARLSSSKASLHKMLLRSFGAFLKRFYGKISPGTVKVVLKKASFEAVLFELD